MDSDRTDFARSPGRAGSEDRSAFAAEDLSVVLLYYVEAELTRGSGGVEAARSRLLRPEGQAHVRHAVDERLNVDDPEVLGQLRKIPVAEGVDIAAVLRSEDYRARVVEVSLERLRIGVDAPTLRIAPDARRPPSGGIFFALIFGAETTLFQDTVLALQADGQAGEAKNGGAVTVLGVHHSWLDGGMRARRALVVDGPGRVFEVGFKEPQQLDVVEILHLPQENEVELYRRISAACEKAQIAQINPYGVSAARADDKMQAYKLWRLAGGSPTARVETPRATLVPRGKGRREVVAAALALLDGRADAELVVQPGHGTEGRLVEAALVCVEDSRMLRGAHPLVLHAVEEILPHDDLLIREVKGNVRLLVEQERRRITFRISVAWNGERFVAESGFAQVAPNESTFAASRGRGGQMVTLDVAFRGLCYRTAAAWKRFVPTPSNLEALRNAATRAAEGINSGLSEEAHLKHMGVDVVLEVDDAGMTPIVLEVNARPAGLASSQEIHPLGHGRPNRKVTDALFHFIRQRRWERSRKGCVM